MTAQVDQWNGGGGDWKASESEHENKHEAVSANENGDQAEIKTGHIEHDGPARDGDNADHDGSGGRGGCFNCGEDGHNKADCTAPRQFSGTCNNCGRDGHMRRDCPDAAPLTCRLCGEEGHMRKDCTNKPPKVCRSCGQDGHDAHDCENPRPIDRSSVETVSPEEAWADLEKATAERDIDDVKVALEKYFKNFPEMDYVELYKALRAQDIKLWIIPTERKLLDTFTNMDLQGNLGKKYTVSYRFSATPSRPREKDGWPMNDEEILSRLTDAGEVVDNGIRKCTNCDQPGHSFKWCPEEKQERERATVMCYNCNETGHRMRDCPIPRPDRFACKNCGKGGHKAADCSEPRSAEGVDCRKCGETGHFSRDCPQGGGGDRGCRNCGSEDHMARECTEPRNMDNVECRNCDEKGHMSKECPKPRDYSRVVCQVCGEKGHTRVRCKKVDEAAPVDGAGFGETAGENKYDHAQEATEVRGADTWGADTAASGGGW